MFMRIARSRSRSSKAMTIGGSPRYSFQASKGMFVISAGTKKGTGVFFRGRGRGGCRSSPSGLVWRGEMPSRPNRADEAGSIYHALNRGNARQTIIHG